MSTAAYAAVFQAEEKKKKEMQTKLAGDDVALQV